MDSSDPAIHLLFEELRQRNDKSSTIKRFKFALKPFLLRFHGRDTKLLSKDDLLEFFSALETKYKPRTQNDIKYAVKRYYKSIGRLDISNWITCERHLNTLKPSQLLTPDEFRGIYELGDTTERAQLALLYDAGVRPEELAGLCVEDFDFRIHPAHVVVQSSSHTKFPRTIPLSDWAAEAVLAYLDATPRLQFGNAMLWASHGTFKSEWIEKRIMDRIRDLTQRARLSKHITLYIFRHSAATRDARDGYSEIQLDLKYGWRFGSKMPQVYIHASGRDLDAVKKSVVVEGKLGEVEERLERIERILSRASGL